MAKSSQPFVGIVSAELTPEHLQAIGEFVVRYSMLESLFIDVFIAYSGLDNDLGRAVMAGNRLKDVIDRTKRVIKIRGLSDKIYLDIEQIETLLDPLSTFRDNVVHRVWMQNEDGPVVMNLTKAKSLAAITREPIPTEELKRKESEALALCLRLIPHYLTDAQWALLPGHYREMMHRPWKEK